MNSFDTSSASLSVYVAPKLELIGSLEVVTQGQSTGGKTDAFFPVGTPRGNITFS